MKNVFYFSALLLTLLVTSVATNNVYAACTTPGALTITSITANANTTSVNINYTTGTNTTNVYFQVWTNSGRTTGNINQLPAIGASVSGTYTFSGLACGTTYWYTFRDYNASGAGCFQTGSVQGSFTTAACATCSDGIQNGTETGVDCGGSCVACAGTSTTTQLCEPCSGGAQAITNAAAIVPTSAGACSNVSIGSTCTLSTSSPYNSDCGPSSMGDQYTTQYRTWYKVQVPATGIVGMQVLPQVGSERDLIKSMLFTNITCGAGTTISSATTGPNFCSWLNPSNCSGSDICGSQGTLAQVTDILGTTDGLGSQTYWEGLTPGSYVWICVDALRTLGGTSPYTSTLNTCFYDSYASNSNNYIGGASAICGSTVSGTTRSSIQGESLCAGYKPPNCGGGPAPSFENVSIYTFTADAVGTDITITLSGATCNGSVNGLQFLIYSQGDVSGCTGTTPICGSGTCTLGSCVGGNTAAGMANKTYTITAPTPNQTFYVLIDGFAGSICSFNLTSTGCVVLPIELTKFKAERAGRGNVLINWQTASERDNDYFLLERSFDGEIFRTIQNIDGAGTSLVVRNYDYLDEVGDDFEGTIYYRLRQVDFNGDDSYSVIRSVEISDFNKQLEILPNPANESVELKFYSKFAGESSSVIIYDVNGKAVFSKEIINDKGLNSLLVNIESFQRGVYTVKISNSSTTLVDRLIKQ